MSTRSDAMALPPRGELTAAASAIQYTSRVKEQVVEAPPVPSPPSPEWGKGTDEPEEGHFLAGPHSRTWEVGRAISIFIEFIRGFRALHRLGPCVTVFGSARFPEDHP